MGACGVCLWRSRAVAGSWETGSRVLPRSGEGVDLAAFGRCLRAESCVSGGAWGCEDCAKKTTQPFIEKCVFCVLEVLREVFLVVWRCFWVCRMWSGVCLG